MENISFDFSKTLFYLKTAKGRFVSKDATLFEPRYEPSNNVVCATSKGSDQPAHTRRLIRAFASGLNIL